MQKPVSSLACPCCLAAKSISHQYREHDMANTAAMHFSGIPESSIFKGNVLICEICGHGWMESPPSDEAIVSYYQKEYWAKRPIVTKVLNADHYQLRARTQIDFAFHAMGNKPMRNALEIGAGAAIASLELRKRFSESVELYVCEPAPEWKDHYKEHSIRLLSAFFPFSSPHRFDYIHTSHWLEHMKDINETIQSLQKSLAANGNVFIEVPNTKYDYWDLSIPDTPHLHFFTPESLKKVFENHGFRCLAMGEAGLTMKEWHDGLRLEPNLYNERSHGFWIRALFQKKNV